MTTSPPLTSRLRAAMRSSRTAPPPGSRASVMGATVPRNTDRAAWAEVFGRGIARLLTSAGPPTGLTWPTTARGEIHGDWCRPALDDSRRRATTGARLGSRGGAERLLDARSCRPHRLRQLGVAR